MGIVGAGSLVVMHGVMNYRFAVIALLLGMLPQASFAECLDEHLRGAIALNRLRAPKYAELSGGRSLEVSRRLIESEKSALLPAKLALLGTQHWRERGVPVLCTEFESMVRVPPPVELAMLDRPSIEMFKGPDASALKMDLEVILDWRLAPGDLTEEAWPVIEGRLQLELEALAPEPRFNCMYRHLVESMIRTARSAPKLVELARSKGVRSPESWSTLLFKEHIKAMPFSLELDRLAAPIQADGIPIVCNDVPPL